MNVRLHPHAAQRIRERGATRAEVIATVRTGRKIVAKFGRLKFTRRFAYGKQWLGRRYAFKEIDAIATREPKGWLVITVIVKFF